MEGEKSCYRSGHFNGGRMVTLQVTLMEGKWSCCRGGQFREGEWSCYGSGQFNGGRMIMLQSWQV